MMDLVHDDRANFIGEEDRLSNLPDDIVHHILSYLNMKHVVQTCALSKRWKHTWTSITYLNLDRDTFLFPSLSHFSRFVKNALSRRNKQTEVEVKLTYTAPTNHADVRSIISDVCLHNVRQLTMTWFSRSIHEFPSFLLSSRILKHLTLNNICHHLSAEIYMPKSVWDLPALETLYLSYMCFKDFSEGNDKSLSLFSKCVKLKDLTFHKCYFYPLMTFNVCCPKLSNLSIRNTLKFPKAVNLVAPYLRNLTATVAPVSHKLTTNNHLHLSTEGLYSLETVNLSLPNSRCDKDIYVSVLLNMFKIFSNAKDVILDVYIIEVLSSWLQDQISPTPCPFSNLKSLKIGNVTRSNRIAKNKSEKVQNYLLRNSPNATFIMNLLKSKKRSRQKVYKDTMDNKVAKLEAEIQKLEQLITKVASSSSIL